MVLKPFIFCTCGEQLTSSGLQGRGGSRKASVAAQVRAMAAWVRFWKWSCGRLWKGQTDLTMLVAALQLLLAVKILTCRFLPFAFCSREKGCHFAFVLQFHESWLLISRLHFSLKPTLYTHKVSNFLLIIRIWKRGGNVVSRRVSFLVRLCGLNKCGARGSWS